jgi:hypothetical protein
MGAVYRVHDRDLDDVVALKTIGSPDPDFVYRLKREFRALAGIVHPHLIQLHDLVVDRNACYFTMELVDGRDFVSYVRRGARGPVDEDGLQRFMEAAPQLVRGLTALHTADRLHRDVKPTNVLVDGEDRLVILDFDLAQPMDEVGVQEDEAGTLSGTFAYMAPEQLWGMPLGPSADWYATGVVFHEALTGELPFGGLPPSAPGTGSPVDLAEPPWDPCLPEGLRILVSSLLDPEPATRPTGRSVLEMLGAGRGRGSRVPSARLARESVGFVGREAERALLRGIASQRDGTRVVGVHGSSGIGKSELIRQSLADLEAGGQAVVLRGRCHPQESVPFKALDPVVDALASYLLAIEPDSRRELLPSDAAALGRLFPVLGRVPELEPGPVRAGTDLVEARRRGVGALRELLRRIAEAVTLVIWIDDAQWSDADSAGLLAELLTPPFSPSLCLVLSYRRADRDSVTLREIAEKLAAEFSSIRFEEIPVEPLSTAECTVLARRLLGDLPSEDSVLDALVAECRGSPFFLAELLWDLERPGARREEARGLDDVIAARLVELPRDDLRVLQLLALCGRPAERSLILEAAQLGERGRPVVQRLEGVGLVRTTGTAARRSIETYHDRIRETVSSRLAQPERQRCHWELAITFEASGRSEPDALAHHFHGAGELPKASDYAVAAAERAEAALAFLQAAEFYRSAVEWHPGAPDHRRELVAREADARTRAAHLVDGGRLFLDAAVGAPDTEGLELRRRAAECLVSGGAVDEGIAVLRALLEELGLRYPRTPRRALLAALARLSLVAVRGFETPASEAAARAAKHEVATLDDLERIRIDTCMEAGKSLVDADSVRGVYFSLVSLARALRAGEPGRLAQSLSVVGGSISVVGEGPLARIGERMMQSALEIASQVDAPELWGTLEVARGQVWMLAGRSREALELSDAGVRRLSEECQGRALEANIGRATGLRALEDLGRLGELEIRAQELRDAAAATGNRYAETAGVQSLAIARIAAGDVAGARELSRHGLALWTRAGFHIQHLYALRIEALCDLYEGQSGSGWNRLAEVEPELRRSGLLRIPLARIDVSSLQGRLALATARADPAGKSRLLRTAGRIALRLARMERSDATFHAAVLRAGVAFLSGRAREAPALLEEAARIAEREGSALGAATARLRAGALSGTRSRFEEARSAMVDCGVREPERWADLQVPGFEPLAPAPWAEPASPQREYG